MGGSWPVFRKFLKIIMINFSRLLVLLNPEFLVGVVSICFFSKRGVHFAIQGLQHSPLRKVYFFLCSIEDLVGSPTTVAALASLKIKDLILVRFCKSPDWYIDEPGSTRTPIAVLITNDLTYWEHCGGHFKL